MQQKQLWSNKKTSGSSALKAINKQLQWGQKGKWGYRGVCGSQLWGGLLPGRCQKAVEKWSEEQWRDYRRVPEPVTSVCCPSDTHPHTFSSPAPCTFDKQPAATVPHWHKQPRRWQPVKAEGAGPVCRNKSLRTGRGGADKSVEALCGVGQTLKPKMEDQE